MIKQEIIKERLHRKALLEEMYEGIKLPCGHIVKKLNLQRSESW